YSVEKIMLLRHHNKTLPSVSAALMAALLVSATALPTAAHSAAEAKAFAEAAVAHIKVEQAATDAGAVNQVLCAADELSRHAEEMTAQVTEFLSAVKTA